MEFQNDSHYLMYHHFRIGDKTFMITYIEANDTDCTCKVDFYTYRTLRPGEVNDKADVLGNIFESFTRSGTHENFFFTTTTEEGVAIRVNLKSGQTIRVKDYHPCDWTAIGTKVNQHIMLSEDENDQAVRISVEFAQRYLSDACLSVANYKSDQYYEWDLSTSAYAVFYEIPNIFGVTPHWIARYLPVRGIEYMEMAGITAQDVFITRFLENMEREIIL